MDLCRHFACLVDGMADGRVSPAQFYLLQFASVNPITASSVHTRTFVLCHNGTIYHSDGIQISGIKPRRPRRTHVFSFQLPFPFVPTIIILAYSLSQDSVLPNSSFFCVVDTKVAWSRYRICSFSSAFRDHCASILFLKTSIPGTNAQIQQHQSILQDATDTNVLFAIIYLVASILSVILGLLNAK